MELGKEDWYDNQFDWGCRKKASMILLAFLAVITLGVWKISGLQRSRRTARLPESLGKTAATRVASGTRAMY